MGDFLKCSAAMEEKRKTVTASFGMS